MKCKLFQLGNTRYQEADRLQKNLLNKIFKNNYPNVLILFESEPIVTLGRNSQKEDLKENHIKKEKVEIIQVDRGGKATYHGPGQIVCFPLFDLTQIKTDIKYYLDCLEKVVIKFLKNYGIEGKKIKSYRGVWVEEKKIASIGIGIKRWISFHGISININVDMNSFYLIRPCGISPERMISLSQILKKSICMKKAFRFAIDAFKEVFDLDFI